MNAQTKHTPGPWVKDRYGQLRSPDNRTIDCYSCGIAGLVTPTEEGIANARLIAAAPELLGLLQELIDIEGPQPGTAEWANKVRAAIARATGEQP